MSRFKHHCITLVAVIGVALAAMAASPTQAQAQDCIRCQLCVTNGHLGHMTSNVAPGIADWGLIDDEHPCEDAGPCWAPTDEVIPCHSPGQMGLTDIKRLQHAAQQHQTTQLVALIRKAGSKIELNAERQSIQVVGCGGMIVANIPIARTQVVALQRLVPQVATRAVATVASVE